MTEAKEAGDSLPLVSIVIPVYNGANYLRQAIESALGQSYPHFEVIVVNDGSTDGGATREIMESYGNRIVSVEKPNGGVATALNAGIKVMRGALFSWLSHDDLYYPEKLARQVDFYLQKTDGRAIVFSHEDTIDAAGRLLQEARPYSFDRRRLYYELLYSRFIGGCSVLVPKAAFDAAGLFDPRYRAVQDYDLWFRMAAKGFVFAYCPITSGMSRIHEAQDSRRKAAQCREEQEDFFIKVQRELPHSLWIGTFENRARAYYDLAFRFGLSGLTAVKRFDLAMGNRGLKGMPLPKKVATLGHRWGLEAKYVYRIVRKRFSNILNSRPNPIEDHASKGRRAHDTIG